VYAGEPWAEFFVTERPSPESIDGEPDLFWFFPHKSGNELMRAEKDPLELQPVLYFGGLGPA